MSSSNNNNNTANNASSPSIRTSSTQALQQQANHQEALSLLQESNLSKIQSHFQQHQIEAYHLLRDPLVMRDFLQKCLSQKNVSNFTSAEFSSLRDLIRAEMDTLFEVIAGRNQMEEHVLSNDSNDQSKQSNLMDKLESIFDNDAAASGSTEQSASNSQKPSSAAATPLPTPTPVSAPKDASSIPPLLQFIVSQFDVSVNETRYSQNGRTLLHYIICCQDAHVPFSTRLQCAKYLCEEQNALPLHDVSSDQENPLHSVCRQLCDDEIFSQILEGTHRDAEREAAKSLCILLIAHRSECVNEKSALGETPLQVLVSSLSKAPKQRSEFLRRMVMLLCEQGASLEEKNKDGKSSWDLLKGDDFKTLKEELEEKFGSSKEETSTPSNTLNLKLNSEGSSASSEQPKKNSATTGQNVSLDDFF